MWPFNSEKEKQQHKLVTPLRKCSCGEMSYGEMHFYDITYCNNCGVVYVIQPVANPVAKVEYVDND